MVGAGMWLERRGCLAWKGIVPSHCQGISLTVGSEGGCQVCGALGVLPTPPHRTLSPPGHSPGTYQLCSQGRTCVLLSVP